MTRDEAVKRLRQLETMCTYQDAYGDYVDTEPFDEAVNMAIEALEQPIPKPHDRLMFWETARRIIDSPRSKSQMLAVLDSVPPIEALERKRGEWKICDAKPPTWWYECSVCGNAGNIEYNYCPNCGADMRSK